ncbi:amino acid ABC transporter substrate-binding protein [Priestia koreensis]|uniref:amino acid ABC transporter substrate-binding protein n=1 Tax=Priestia koreensis TaxID=284581 RepID=UPI00203E1B6E|nr:amino acid ABC transporter substrate-binding protein [Priestia koreensis]MCM3004727.1 amino acid ABC transporter substrate-binding protein [Priestia koreensis]
MKKLLSMLVVISSLVLVLAACGTSDKSDNAGADLYKEVKKSGELKIGTEGTYPPFTFNKGGKLTGFDVDIAREVAKRLGVKPVFVQTQWDSLFAGLNAKRFDVIANEVGIRKDRQKKYDFSDPYISSAAVLVTAKNNKDIKDFKDLKGKKAAQSLTSNYRKIAEDNGADIVGIEGLTQSMDLITQGRVDATVNDKLAILDYLNRKPNSAVKIVKEEKDSAESAFLFRKDSEKLVKEVNKALADMKKDGTYEKISKKWFGEDVSPK